MKTFRLLAVAIPLSAALVVTSGCSEEEPTPIPPPANAAPPPAKTVKNGKRPPKVMSRFTEGGELPPP